MYLKYLFLPSLFINSFMDVENFFFLICKLTVLPLELQYELYVYYIV